MIDFKYTEESKGVISYVNQNGDVVKTYPLFELEQYVEANSLNIMYEVESEGGTGMVCDPNTAFNEVEVIQPISDYIDDNFDQVTKDFYMAKNPSEFKPTNRVQETRKALK